MEVCHGQGGLGKLLGEEEWGQGMGRGRSILKLVFIPPLPRLLLPLSPLGFTPLAHLVWI